MAIPTQKSLDRFPRGLRLPLYRRVFARINRLVDPVIGPFRLRFAARRRPLRIVVGSSGIAPRGWVPTDRWYLDLTKPEMWRRFMKAGSVDAILAEHVWEHLSPEQAVLAVRTCREFLANSGYMRIAVPDAWNPSTDYQQWIQPGGRGPGAHDHKVIYNVKTMTALLRQEGFDVEALEWFDEGGQFHEQPWDPAKGKIERSRRFDHRNADGQLRYTSLIVEARPRRSESTSERS